MFRYIAILIVACFHLGILSAEVNDASYEALLDQRVLFGTVSLASSYPSGEKIQIIIRTHGVPPLSKSIVAKDGKIQWQSPPLPPGLYEIVYILPPPFDPVLPQRFAIRRGENIVLKPHLFASNFVHVMANIPDVVFILRNVNGSKVWKGEGRAYTFLDIPAGQYILSLSSPNMEFFIPPKEQRLYLADRENKEVNSVFQAAGKLVISTNVEGSLVAIRELGGKGYSYESELKGKGGSFTLPPGRYQVKLFPNETLKTDVAKLHPPEPIDINVIALQSEEVVLSYKTEKVPPPVEAKRKLAVDLNISFGGFTINKVSGDHKYALGHFSGKNVQITLPPADQYEIVFDDIANYKTPEQQQFKIAPNEEKKIKVVYTAEQQLSVIPEGKAIIGNATSEENINELPARIVTISPFSIGTFEVTNAQYADWLSQAFKAGKISIVKEADQRGQVIDMDGRLLFKTFEADPYSQISAQMQSNSEVNFTPLPGKNSFPVINVSWYGAYAYCLDNGCRLPTEAEWEKAAGMAPESPGRPLRKFLFGFGRNEIDPSWANYKISGVDPEYFQVQTTPVGFFNGTNNLPLNVLSKSQQTTHLAKSPYGAFDMSGNVWEWVADWYDESYYEKMSDKDPQGPPNGTKKVVKGGCYDSFADGVRVSERLGLPPDHTDAYTGFRIAK